jgi:hypothetical protein
MTLHQEQTHPIFVEGCFGCKVGTIMLSATVFAAGSNGAHEVVAALKMDKKIDVDRPAYKRLRAEGFQPKHVIGSAALERDATTRFEVETGTIHSGKQAKQLQTALRGFEDMSGKSAFTPVTKPNAA